MNKQKSLWIVQNSIFLVIFNVAFFVVGGIDHKALVWISYGFIHFAYFMLLLTPQLIRGEKSWTALGFPLYSVSAFYFLAEFLIGTFFILIAWFLPISGYKLAMLVQLSIAGLYGIALVSNMIANEYTAAAEEERQEHISYIKNASAKLKELLEIIDDKEAKKKVERVYDTLHSSPVTSRPDLADIETQILQGIDKLAAVIQTGNKDRIIVLSDSLETAINERNNTGRLSVP